MWNAEFVDEVVQVYPINDIIPHELMDNGDCPCLPRFDVFGTPYGSDYTIVHNAWDGRE